MPRGECTFRKRDLKVALEAAQEAGQKVVGFKITRAGEIVVQIDNDRPVAYAPLEVEEENPCDVRQRELGLPEE